MARRQLSQRHQQISDAQARLQTEQKAARHQRQRVAQARRQLAALLQCDYCQQPGLFSPASRVNPEEVICPRCWTQRVDDRRREAKAAAFTMFGRHPVTGELLPKEARRAVG